MHSNWELRQDTKSVNLDRFPRSPLMKISMISTDPAGFEIRPRSKGFLSTKSHLFKCIAHTLHLPASYRGLTTLLCKYQPIFKAGYSNNLQALVSSPFSSLVSTFQHAAAQLSIRLQEWPSLVSRQVGQTPGRRATTKQGFVTPRDTHNPWWPHTGCRAEGKTRQATASLGRGTRY